MRLRRCARQECHPYVPWHAGKGKAPDTQQVARGGVLGVQLNGPGKVLLHNGDGGAF